MNDRERAAVSYLTPPVYSFWIWSDGGEACEWRDGKTIAFRAEIEEVLRRLERRPLPPLGAILLLLAAARDSWDDGGSEMGILSGLLELLRGHETIAIPSHESAQKTWSTDLVIDAFCTLDSVHQLPPDLRHSFLAKAEIVALVCDGAGPRDRTTSADDVLAALEKQLHATIEGSALGELAKRVEPFKIKAGFAPKESLHSLRSSLQCLCLKSPLDPEQLRLRLKTGLNELPSPLRLELSPAEQTRALINSLQDDVELGGVARLARNLLAAVHLPKPIAEIDEMPLGGVSDIANRGTLDRLLLSELAHDDLTLSVRVAMNEALYLRRESPPRSPPRERFVLLDVGLRTWGVPRVFATAIALAIAATGDRQVETQVYRGTDDDLAVVDFTSRSGLVDHLGALATAAHPAAALAALVDQVESPALSDAILITTADTVADPEFARELASLQLSSLHVATVDRDGAFRLLLVSRQGQKVLRETRFALDELLTPTRTSTLIDRDQRDQPAILSVQPFPLLLAHPFDLGRAWFVAGHGAFSISRDRRLLRWTASNQGGKQIADNLPPGDLHWAASEPDRNGIVRAVVGRLGQRGLRLLLIDLNNDTCTTRELTLEADSPRSVTAYQGVIYVIFDHHVEAFDASSAETYPRLPTEGVVWRQGRFFRNPANNRWYALGFDGLRPKLEAIPATVAAEGEVLTVFDCSGAEGPLAVTNKGAISPFGGKSNPIRVFDRSTSSAEVVALSRDGMRVALQEKQSQKARGGFIVDVVKPRQTSFLGNPHDAVEADLKRLIHPRAMRHRFMSIVGLEDGMLALSTGKRGWWRLTLGDTSDSIYLRHMQLDTHDAARYFDAVKAVSDIGYTLLVATWSDGSTAFLDSRGLLHLRSSDAAIPEATIVLSEGQMAGWIADGRYWGAAYFVPSGVARIRGSEFHEQVLRPFVSRISC